MRTSRYPNPGWSFAPHQQHAEVQDILRREFEARTASDPGATYDPRPVSALHAALNQALALDDASKEAVRPILGNREVAALLRDRLGSRGESDDSEGGADE